MTGTSKTFAFFGASTGIGLAALKITLAAGHQCIALCRFPGKLTAIFPEGTTPNLKIIEGNAHDIAVVSKCLVDSDGKLVDAVVSTIGNPPSLNMSNFDKEVCGKAARILLQAIAELRRNGAAGNPHLISVSSTGISKFGRDTPVVIVPLYKILLKTPHEDKRVMENTFTDGGESFTVVRATWLTNGGVSPNGVRVGIEDPKKGTEVKAIGYSISRADAGKWIAENLVLNRDAKYANKIATITY
jgi:nucleoside-diphosphate-sugar epimerase